MLFEYIEQLYGTYVAFMSKTKKKKCEEDVKKNINGQVTCTQAKYFHRNFYTK